MKKLNGLLRFSAFFCALFFSTTTLAWWNEDWPYRMAVNLDASATGANLSETNQDITVLLKLHSGNFPDFFLVKEDLADFRFIAGDDKTPLKYHVEHADLINQLIYVWVKIPSISAGINTEKFWLYYGNETAVSAGDPAASFDVHTAVTYHFSGGQSLPRDATAYGIPMSGFTGSLSNSSLIAGGVVFAAGNRLAIDDAPALAVTPDKGLTVSFWFKPAGDQADAVLFERVAEGTSLQVILRGSSIVSRYSTATGKIYETAPAAGVRAGTWQHLALVLAADRMALYLDGNTVSFAGIVLEPISGAWTFAGASAGGQDYVGELDELVIATTARNASWIKAVAINQGPMNSLLVPQAAEQLGSGGGGGLWTTLFKSNDESGWTVIFLCGLMALFSWAVMVGKFLYIRRVGKDNRGFLAEYNKIKFKNPALLDYEMSEEEQQLESTPILQAIFGKHDHYQSSPIFRLYHRGIQEVQERMPKSARQTNSGLNSQSVEAIKAAIDAQIVREVQRLNSKMVLLTIAISGGPFLGLLGTVLGVMMTFAAIAMTGDVNISAIAPGVAAALLTTVAGLLVAIPALFGYNYLMTRIKEHVADMKVFADEYVTRLAEYYRDVGVPRSNAKQKDVA